MSKAFVSTFEFLFLLFCRSCSLVACRFGLFVTIPNLDGLRLDVNYRVFVPPRGFNLKRFATTEIDRLKKCTWHFQTSVGSSRFLKLPIRNNVCFSDGIVRMKSRWWCQHPFVHPFSDVLENFCVCWDMLM